MTGPYGIEISPWCIMTGIHSVAIGLPYYVVPSVEEADVEDPQGNVTKELFMLPIAPLEPHAGYRLETEDFLYYSSTESFCLIIATSSSWYGLKSYF